MTEIHDNTPNKSSLLRGIIAFVLLLVVGVIAFRVMGRLRKKPKKKNVVKALSLKVSTRTVRYKSMTLYLKGFATAESYRSIDLVPEVSGKVTYTIKPFKPGTFVKKGRALFRIERGMYALEHEQLKAQNESLKKQIAISKNAYIVSRRNLARNKRLVRRRALDQGSYERLEQAVLDRNQRLESLNQALRVNEVMLKRAALNLRRTTLWAPFHARISRGSLTRGSYVSMGRSVGTIESIESIELPVSFSLEMLKKISDKNGREAPLKQIPALLSKLPPVKINAGGSEYPGRVERTGANIDLSTRTIMLYVRVDLAKLKQIGELLPGTFCQVKIPARRMPRAFKIPRRALYGNKVYITQNKKLSSRLVNISYSDSEFVFVTGGLEEGDKVVVSALVDPVIGTPVFANDGGRS